MGWEEDWGRSPKRKKKSKNLDGDPSDLVHTPYDEMDEEERVDEV